MKQYSEILQKLVPELIHIFQQTVYRVILYGSVARGTQTQQSDIDIAVIVKSHTKNMHDSMIDYVVDLELEYNVVLSVLLIDYDKYKEWENIMPFYRNVKKDGIILWQAA